jgi:23S rRNA (cytosine1962-C5)-methyltransferase
VRVLDFRTVEIDGIWFAGRLRAADERRQIMGYGPGTDTTGYRVVFGEADGLPGLVVDRYDDVLVIQVSTSGMNRLKPLVLHALEAVFSPRAIYERSDLPSRKEEGLPEMAHALLGDPPEPVLFDEHGLKFLSDPVDGQKTGFFLDQKDLRLWLRRLASGRRMLNLFSYTGAHSVAALAGGTVSTLNVDISPSALAMGQRQAELNGMGGDRFVTEQADVFQWLAAERPERYSLVVLDPPALIKSAKDAEQGRKAYHFLCRAALRLVEDGGLFVFSSCSHHFTEDDLAFTLRRASVQAGVVLDPIANVRQSADHPVSVYFPESAYLKTFIAQVRRT